MEKGIWDRNRERKRCFRRRLTFCATSPLNYRLRCRICQVLNKLSPPIVPSRADRLQAQSRPFAAGAQEYEEPTRFPRLSFTFGGTDGTWEGLTVLGTVSREWYVTSSGGCRLRPLRS